MAAEKTNLKKTVADCQASAKAAAERLLKTFSFVPDNKLSWTPSKTARSSLGIVAHCCMANQMFAKILRGESVSPMPTLQQIHEMSQKFEATIHDRAEAVRQLEASCEEVVAALGTMTADRFATSPVSPGGEIPMAVWMSLPSMHTGGHATQIDYLQTIWGDVADHM
jgi:hypothetical protein